MYASLVQPDCRLAVSWGNINKTQKHEPEPPIFNPGTLYLFFTQG